MAEDRDCQAEIDDDKDGPKCNGGVGDGIPALRKNWFSIEEG